MHDLEELIYLSTEFTLYNLEKVNSKIIDSLQTSGSTLLVKNLQMIQLQKAIFVVGVFSLFESILQQNLSCDNGLNKAKKILLESGNNDLWNSLNDFQLAINVLKHGKGPSYNKLIERVESLPFTIKSPDDSFFNEGDVSEISALIDVDNKFIIDCAEILKQVCDNIKSYNTN